MGSTTKMDLLDVGPIWSSGIIQKIVSYKGFPVIIQASAAVHTGNSGGMLLDKEGSLLGLVTCNTRVAEPVPPNEQQQDLMNTEEKTLLHTGKEDSMLPEPVRRRRNFILTRLNFSIPIEELNPLINFLNATDRVDSQEIVDFISTCDSLSKEDLAKRNIWSFKSPISLQQPTDDKLLLFSKL
jgi:hypothetical protein